MSAIEEVEWEACPVEPVRDPEVERFLRQELGFLPPATRFVAAVPWLARSTAHLSGKHGGIAHLDRATAELIGLVVSRDNSCRYCFAASRFLMRVTGIPEERIRRLEQDLLTADFSPAQRAALDFARRLSRASPLPGAGDLQALREAGWSEGEVKEIAAGAAIVAGINRVPTLLALPPERMEALPDRWPVRLFGGLLALIVTRRERRGEAETVDPERLAGPFAYVTRALNGVPSALSLRTVIDEAWSSTLLSTRAKALVCAVVARGLGDAAAERESARLLADEGVDADELEGILSHLSSPRLDPVEAAVVPLARETIWYKPAHIQRRVSELRGTLDPAQLVELVGMTSLANMLGRLGVLAAP